MILKNALMIQSNGSLLKKDIKILNKKIVKIADKLYGDHEIDLQGKLVMPGLVDVHVHLREPGFTDKETIKTGTLAAAMGGYTTVCAMPNTNPPVDSIETLNQIKLIIEKDALVNVYQYAAITKGLTSNELVDIKGMDAFAYSNDGKGIQSSATMLEAMRELKKYNKILVAHTEDEELVFGGVMHEGERNKELGLPGMLSVVESAQIARDLALAYQTKVKYHICHVSSKESLEMIKFAKDRGVDVSCEVSAHHLLLNEHDIVSDDAVYKMHPPLRSREDQKALLKGIQNGTIDMIASDHAPHTDEEKSRGFLGSPFGIIGSELTFPLLYTKLVLTNKLTLQDLVELMCVQPAQRFNLPTTEIVEGNTANLSVFDLETEESVTKNKLGSKSSNTPFMNEKLKGFCTMTLVNGAIVWQSRRQA